MATTKRSGKKAPEITFDKKTLKNGDYFQATVKMKSKSVDIKGRVKLSSFNDEIQLLNNKVGYNIMANINLFYQKKRIIINDFNREVKNFVIITDPKEQTKIDAQEYVQIRNWPARYGPYTDMILFGCGDVKYKREQVLKLIQLKQACEDLAKAQEKIVKRSVGYMDIDQLRELSLAKLKTLLTILPRDKRKLN